MVKKTDDYYTDIDLMNFIDTELLPYVQKLAEESGLDKKDLTVTYANSSKSFTLWVTDKLDGKPTIIADISINGELNGGVNKYESNTKNGVRVDEFIDNYLDAIREFIRHDLNN